MKFDLFASIMLSALIISLVTLSGVIAFRSGFKYGACLVMCENNLPNTICDCRR